MRALPQIDIHPQPVPSSSDAPARTASRGESNSFAETLQRKSAAEARPPRQADDAPAESPQRVVTPQTDKPARDSAAADDAADAAAATDAASKPATTPADDVPTTPTADHADAAAQAAIVAPAPTPDVTLPTLALADDGAATAATPAVNDTATALVSGLPVNPALPYVVPANHQVASSTAVPLVVAPVANTTTPVLPATKPAAVITPNATTALANSAADADAPSAEVTAIIGASAAPVGKPVASTATAKNADIPALVDDTAPALHADDASTALPPITPTDTNASIPPALVANDVPLTLNELKPAAEDAIATTMPVSATSSATPAAQSAGMHAVAAAIGDHERSEASAETPTVTNKNPSDVVSTLAPPTPTAPVTPTRPMSETVLAQNTLAANGNAMEKAVSHQISKALVQQLPNGDRMMVLRLTPPELGTVKIEVIERQGVFTARLHAEDDGVRLALERFLPSMRQDLRASDAPIRELTLSDQTQFQRSFADGQNQSQQDADRSGNRRARSNAPHFSIDGVRTDPIATPRAAPLGGRVGASGVDARA